MAKKIMVIDDEPYVVEQLSHILIEHGYQPIPAKSALEAMSRLTSEHPDLVLLDIRMPQINGIEFLSRLRQTLRTKDMPVIIISGVSDAELQLQARKMGALRYITKPYRIDELLELIQTVFEGPGAG